MDDDSDSDFRTDFHSFLVRGGEVIPYVDDKHSSDSFEFEGFIL